MLLLEDKMMGIFDNIEINVKDDIFSDEIGDGDCPYLNDAIELSDDELIKKYNSYEIETGATKCVVIPYGCPYVIKMPIKGFRYEDIGEDDSEIIYREYRNSNSEPRWNYCEAEALAYELAEEHGVEKFFAETFYWKMTDGDYPLYLQEKVQSRRMGRPSARSSTLACNYYDEGIIEDELWLAFFIDWYGINNLDKLMNFLAEEGINDLCDRNLGYRESGAPVIFDYSGYNG